MLKNIIVIENGKKYQCDTEKELVKMLVSDDYYNMSNDKKLEMLKIKAIANSINNKFEIVEPQESLENISVDNKFILLDEKSYILSLLMTNNIILLENIESNFFVKYLDKDKFNKNYIIINNFAKQILKDYLKDK